MPRTVSVSGGRQLRPSSRGEHVSASNSATYREFSEDEERTRGLTISEQSPFKRHFDALVLSHQDRDDVEDGSTLNPHFSLDCWHVINKPMYLLPLWSGVKLSTVKFCSGKPF